LADASADSSSDLRRDDILTRDRGHDEGETVREAGCWRCRCPQPNSRTETKARIGRCRRATSGPTNLTESRILRSAKQDYGWAIGRSVEDCGAAKKRMVWIVDRRTARRAATSTEPRGLVRQCGAGRGRVADAGGGIRFSAGQPTSFSSPGATAAPLRRTASGFHETSGTEMIFPAVADQNSGRTAQQVAG